jgi:hypothetical protein
MSRENERWSENEAPPTNLPIVPVVVLVSVVFKGGKRLNRKRRSKDRGRVRLCGPLQVRANGDTEIAPFRIFVFRHV